MNQRNARPNGQRKFTSGKRYAGRSQKRRAKNDLLHRLNVAALAVFTTALAVILVLTVMDTAQMNQRAGGGIVLLGPTPNVSVYGPEAPEGVHYSYMTQENIRPAEIITPAPTEEPEQAFVNDSGKYFHKESCKYVTEKTRAYYIPTLLARGFQPCKLCNAQDLVYDNENP